MEKVCSSKPDAAFTPSPPTEFVLYNYSKKAVLFQVDIWPREPEPRRRDLFFRGQHRPPDWQVPETPVEEEGELQQKDACIYQVDRGCFLHKMCALSEQ